MAGNVNEDLMKAVDEEDLDKVKTAILHGANLGQNSTNRLSFVN